MEEPLGGYEYQFVETPADWLICKICHYPSREPFLSGCCGHTFCRTCLDMLHQKKDSCPLCRSEEFNTILNKQADRFVRGLHVFCTNKEKGCEWKGEVNDIANHIENSKGCHFQEVKCPKDCGKCLQRQNLTKHVKNECIRRMVECQYCFIIKEYQFIDGIHKNACPKFPLPCPNNCSVGTIPRENINEHKRICLLEKVNCSNDCGITVQRRHLKTHVNKECPSRKVSCMHCCITGKYQFIEGKHKEQCPLAPVPCPNLCKANSILRKDINEHKKTCPLEGVICSNGCGITLERQHLMVHVKLKCLHRKVNCQYCNVEGQHRFIGYGHIEECPKLPISCPNQCKVVVPRDQLNQHLKICPLEEIQCEYHVVGCEETMARKDQKEHNSKKIQHHLSLAKDALVAEKTKQRAKEQSDENNLSQKLKQTEADLMKTKQTLAATTKSLQLAQQDIAVTKENLISAENKLAYTADILRAFQNDARKTMNELTENFADIKRSLCSKITEMEFKLQQQEITHQMDWPLSSNWYKSIYLKATEFLSGDQTVPVVMRISDYFKKKQNGDIWHSKPFYTHHKGYKMCVQVSFTGPHFCVKLFLMKGPNDDKLKWPLTGQCEITLYNQLQNNKHYIGDGKHSIRGLQRVTDGEMGEYSMWYSYWFIREETLCKIANMCQYLRDNVIFLLVNYKL